MPCRWMSYGPFWPLLHPHSRLGGINGVGNAPLLLGKGAGEVAWNAQEARRRRSGKPRPCCGASPWRRYQADDCVPLVVR